MTPTPSKDRDERMMEATEAVARAIALADLDPETRAIVDLDAHMAHVREHYTELAIAALNELRRLNLLSDGEGVGK